MSVQISTSTNFDDYEILIRKRADMEYASYCPQLNLMLTGTYHEEVYNLMNEKISEHIETIKNQVSHDPSLN